MNISDRQKELNRMINKLEYNINLSMRTCLNCEHFQGGNEICVLYNKRPPAEIIAFGCEKFEEQLIPF